MSVYKGDISRPYPSTLPKRPPDYRKEGSTKFYSDGGVQYSENIEIKKYYATSDETELIRVEERFRLGIDSMALWSQTISGSGFSQQWPAYDHYVLYHPWEYTTYSG